MSAGPPLKLRAHHLFCGRFWQVDYTDRGPAFCLAEAEVTGKLKRDPDLPVELIEGVDDLCRVCPHRAGDRCTSPLGDEPQVRKLDAVIAGELGWRSGTVQTVGQWHGARGTPLMHCHRCRWLNQCAMRHPATP